MNLSEDLGGNDENYRRKLVQQDQEHQDRFQAQADRFEQGNIELDKSTEGYSKSLQQFCKASLELANIERTVDFAKATIAKSFDAMEAGEQSSENVQIDMLNMVKTIVKRHIEEQNN